MSLSKYRNFGLLQLRVQYAVKQLISNGQNCHFMAGLELRLQCPGAIYETLTSKGNKLPYLLIVCCSDMGSANVVACPDLALDYEASSAAYFALLS